MHGLHQRTTMPTTSPDDVAGDERAFAPSLQNRDIVYLSHQRWNKHMTPTHNMVRHMVRTNRVLFIEPPESVGWLLHESPARQALRWIFSPLERLEANLYLYHTPPLFPPGQARSSMIAATVNALYTFHIRRAMRLAGFGRSVFWIV